MPVVRRVAPLLAVGVLGGFAGALVLGAGAVEGDAGPGVVRLSARLDVAPRTELLLPPLGSVSASTHGAPVTLSARVERVDVAQLEDLMGDEDAERKIRSDIEDDLSSLARRLFLRCLLIAAAAGVVLGAVLPGRRWTTVVAGGSGGLTMTAVLLWAAWANFDATAFDEPRFEGPVREAPRVLATAQKYVDDFEAVRGRVEVLSAQVRDLYATSLTDELAEGPGRRRILHVSDLHLNPVGVEVLRELAQRFRVDAVLDSGDITSFGNPLEAQFGELLAGLDVPYYLVPGNHDADGIRSALAGSGNVIVIDGEAVDIAGVSVLGVGHPVFTADNRLSDGEVAHQVGEQAKATARLVDRLQPDVLVVHDPKQAAEALGDVPLVLAGHVHRRTWDEVDGTLMLTVGTTGATGLGAFTVDTSLAYEAAVLYFDGSKLVAVDNIALRGTNGEFRIDRRLAPTEEDVDERRD